MVASGAQNAAPTLCRKGSDLPQVTPPLTTVDEDFFWKGVSEDKLLLASCASCSYLQHPPTPMCPQCGSLEWNVIEASGGGTVLSWIVSRHPSQPDDRPRVVALIELEEGARLVSNLVEVDTDQVLNDIAVEVTFADVDQVRLPQFRPVRQVVS
jgi:uncharacterized protein